MATSKDPGTAETVIPVAFQAYEDPYLEFVLGLDPEIRGPERAIFDQMIERGMLRIDGQSRVLDFGTGIGRLPQYLINHPQIGLDPSNLVGVDPCKRLLEVAAQRIPQARFFAASDLNLKEILGGEKFDFIVSNMVLNHIPYERLVTLFEVFVSLLEDTGGIAFVVPHPYDRANNDELPPGHLDWYSPMKMIEPSPWGGSTVYHYVPLSMLHNLLSRYLHDTGIFETGRKDKRTPLPHDFPTRVGFCAHTKRKKPRSW